MIQRPPSEGDTTNPYTAPGRPAPKWARKRYALPALGLAFFLGIVANLLPARATLPGITVDARGLIIMGREDVTDSAREIRDRHSANDRIEIRTYDWLLRAGLSADSTLPGLLDTETGDLDRDW